MLRRLSEVVTVTEAVTLFGWSVCSAVVPGSAVRNH